MALKIEGVVDRSMHAEGALSGSSRFEPLHLPFSSPHRLMRILGAIVLPEPLFMRAGQLQLSERRAVGAQLVSYQQFRHKPLLSEKLAHQPQRRPAVAATLDQHVKDLAFVSGEAARDAYVQGCDLALTFYPGAIEAFDRATAADPGFSLPHAAKAQVLMREGNVAAARAALVAAKDLATGVLEREASHITYFDLAFAGQTDAAIAALYAHLAAWPRDALVLATAANPNGLIGASGRIGQKHQIAALMD